MRLRKILAAITALATLSLLTGCIFVERGGHGGRCDLPRHRAWCDAGRGR